MDARHALNVLCIAQTGSRHILPLLIFPMSCSSLHHSIYVTSCVLFFFAFFFFRNFYLLKSPLNASYSLWHALNGLRLNFHNTHLPSSLHKPLAISVSRQLWIMASDCLCRCVHRVTHCWAVPFDTCEHICEYIVVMHVESSSLPRIALPSSHTYQVILPLPCIGQSHPCA